MGNTTTLAKVMADSDLKRIFEKLLEKRGLSKIYELATIHKDEMTVIQIYFANITQKERAFAPNIYDHASRIWDGILQTEHEKVAKRIEVMEGARRDLVLEEMREVNIAARASAEWKKFFKLTKVVLNQKLDEFARREVPHTPEYAEYVRKKAKREAEQLAREHEQDREIDDWLKLGVALGTGDNASATRLSQSLSKKHKPKKGKVKSPGEILKAAKTRLAKLFPL